MRDDVKIGILLGCLIILAVFIFWMVRSPEETKSGPTDIQGQPTSKRPTDRAPEPEDRSLEGGTALESNGQAVELSEAEMPKLVSMHPWGTLPDYGVLSVAGVPLEAARMPAGIVDLTEWTRVRPGPVTPPTPSGVTPGGDDRPIVDNRPPVVGPAVDPNAAWAALPPGPNGAKRYKVEPGDNASLLAERLMGPGQANLDALLSANPQVSDWQRLRVGGTLNIPRPVAAGTVRRPGSRTVGADEYEIQKGDMLGDLAHKWYGRSSLWEEIVKANPGLDPDRLKPGTIIKKPKLTVTRPPAGTTSQTGTPPAGAAVPPGHYKVRAGDTLSEIADKVLGKSTRWMEIYNLNKDKIGPDPDALKDGMLLKMPGAAATPPAATPPGPVDEPISPSPSGGTGSAPLGPDAM